MFVGNGKKITKDVIGMPCIRSKDRNLKVSLEEKVEVSKKYEQKILNEENKRSGGLKVVFCISGCFLSRGFCSVPGSNLSAAYFQTSKKSSRSIHTYKN